MKKKLISILSIIIMLGMVNLASAFTIDSSLIVTGEWTEMYLGGHPGAPGNSLNAQSIELPPVHDPELIEWTLNNMLLNHIIGPPTDIGDDGWQYTTLYTGGALTMTGFSTFTNLAAIVVANIYPDWAFGTIQMTGSNNSFILSMTADLDYIEPLDGGHWGTIFGFELTMDDIPTNQVPEPASLLLFGLGLVGIAGIGRKFKK